MEKIHVSLDEFKKDPLKALMENNEHVQIIYNYDDLDENLGFYFLYIETGIVIYPFQKVLDKQAIADRSKINMMAQDDIYRFDQTKMYYERKKKELQHILKHGKMEEEDVLFDNLYKTLHEEGISNESQLSDHISYYEILYTPVGEDYGQIFIPLKDGVASIPFNGSNPEHGYEFLEIDKLRHITSSEEKELKEILHYYEKAIEDLEFAINKQRLRTLTTSE